MKRKKCYIYTRVSTAAQTEGFSLEAQQERLREYAEYRDLDIVGEYCDAGKSGKSIKGRPEFQQMMEDIITQKDAISFVLVFKLSRFGRNAADVVKSMQTLVDYGIDLVSVDDAIDSSTQGGRLTLTILSAVAEIERENITTQFVAGKIQKIKDGKWSGGPVPYGYRSVDRELVQDPEEAEIVRIIYEMYLQDGTGINTISTWLNDNGYRRKEKPFTAGFVKSILDNPIYCGTVTYGLRANKKDRNGKVIKPDPKDAVIVKGSHEPVVSEEIWQKVQEKRQQFAKKKVHDPERISLLSGLVRCPVCGGAMISSVSRKRHPDGGTYKPVFYYSCNNNRKSNGRTCSFSRRYNQEKVDGAVYETVTKLQMLPEFREAVLRHTIEADTVEKLEEKLKEDRKQIRKLELHIKHLGEELDGLDVLDETYEDQFDRIQSEIEAGYDEIEEVENDIRSTSKKLEAEKNGLKASEHIEKMLDTFPMIYEKMSCQERRDMYKDFIDRVELCRETRADGRLVQTISFRFPVVYGESDAPADAISFALDCLGQEKTAAESKATYAELRRYIKETYGKNVPSLYIAQIKRKYGLKIGDHYNMAKDPSKHVPTCTPEKEELIVAALRHFKMLA